MKVYDLVKKIMLTDSLSRNSDKYLMRKVWEYQAINFYTNDDWMKRASHPKSIIESRRNLQRDQEQRMDEGEDIPDNEILIADKKVLKYREEINRQKGTHIFRDEVANQNGLF